MLQEAKTVIEGTKILLKGELVCMKSVDTKEHVIVEVEHDNNDLWAISVDMMKQFQPKCAYLSFYNSQQQMHPERRVVTYRETVLTALQFALLYKEVMDRDELQRNTSKMLDYAGVSHRKKIKTKDNRFQNWYTDTEKKILACGINDYFTMMEMALDLKDVIPYQIVTIETSEFTALAWLGVGVNQFVCCDIVLQADEQYEQKFNRMPTLTCTMMDILPKIKWSVLPSTRPKGRLDQPKYVCILR
jgi:hypothetical protein